MSYAKNSVIAHKTNIGEAWVCDFISIVFYSLWRWKGIFQKVSVAIPILYFHINFENIRCSSSHYWYIHIHYLNIHAYIITQCDLRKIEPLSNFRTIYLGRTTDYFQCWFRFLSFQNSYIITLTYFLLPILKIKLLWIVWLPCIHRTRTQVAIRHPT